MHIVEQLSPVTTMCPPLLEIFDTTVEGVGSGLQSGTPQDIMREDKSGGTVPTKEILRVVVKHQEKSNKNVESEEI